MTNRAIELLYDSEATLRLVDRELDALRAFTDGAGAAAPASDPASAPAADPLTLRHASGEIGTLLQRLRECRAQPGPSGGDADPAAVLAEMETRLSSLARLFDGTPASGDGGTGR